MILKAEINRGGMEEAAVGGRISTRFVATLRSECALVNPNACRDEHAPLPPRRVYRSEHGPEYYLYVLDGAYEVVLNEDELINKIMLHYVESYWICDQEKA